MPKPTAIAALLFAGQIAILMSDNTIVFVPISRFSKQEEK